MCSYKVSIGLFLAIVLTSQSLQATSITGQVNQANNQKLDNSVIQTKLVVPAVVSSTEAGGSFPGDPNMAAGLKQLISVVNSAVVITDKATGNRLNMYQALDFWNIVPPNIDSGISDPVVLFDEFSNRFILVEWERVGFDANAELMINSPAPIAGTYPASKGALHASQVPFDLLGLPIVPANPISADTALSNNLSGDIALIASAGFNVGSRTKGDNAANAGAVGAIIYNTDLARFGDTLISINGSSIIPTVSVGNAIGQAMVANTPVIGGIRSLDITEVGTNGYDIMHVAVSKTATPTSKDDFYFYHIGTPSGPWGGGLLSDFPKLGIDASALYISTQSADYPADSLGLTPVYAQVVAIEKAPLISGTGPANIKLNDFKLMTSGVNFETTTANYEAGYRTPTIVRPNAAKPNVMYTVIPKLDFPTSLTQPASGSALTVTVISDILGTPHLNEIDVPVAPWNAVNLGTVDGDSQSAAQPQDVFKFGGTTGFRLETILTLMNYRCVVHDKSLWCVQVVGGPDIYSLVWYELDISNALAATPSITLKQQGTIQASDGTSSLFFPSIDVDKDGNMAVGFSITGPTQPVGIGYTGRLVSDPPGTVRPYKTMFIALKNFPYYRSPDNSGGSRWGDYSSMTIDPADGKTFYYFNQYFYSKDRNDYRNGANPWTAGYVSFTVGN